MFNSQKYYDSEIILKLQSRSELTLRAVAYDDANYNNDMWLMVDNLWYIDDWWLIMVVITKIFVKVSFKLETIFLKEF